MGSSALTNNTIGNNNIALGNSALTNNTIGNNNIALGSSALTNNTIGEENISIGRVSMTSNTTGTNNVGVGSLSLTTNTIGYFNTAIGYGALKNNTIGKNNTAIGAESGIEYTTEENNICIGNYGQIGDFNKIRLGQSQTSFFVPVRSLPTTVTSYGYDQLYYQTGIKEIVSVAGPRIIVIDFANSPYETWNSQVKNSTLTNNTIIFLKNVTINTRNRWNSGPGDPAYLPASVEDGVKIKIINTTNTDDYIGVRINVRNNQRIYFPNFFPIVSKHIMIDIFGSVEFIFFGNNCYISGTGYKTATEYPQDYV